MNKKAFSIVQIIVAVGLILLLGVGGYFVAQKFQSTPGVDVQETVEEIVEETTQDVTIADTEEEPKIAFEEPEEILTADPDTDNDNLALEDEEKYCTDPNNPDTDGDGYLDGDEVEAGYNPNGEGTLVDYIASGYTCDAELNNKRDSVTQEVPPNKVTLDTSCDAFADKLDSCTKYKCQFIHPFTGGSMAKEILGIVSGKCNYTEEMPNNGKMECGYTEDTRRTMAQYYKDLASAETYGFEGSIGFGNNEGAEFKYTINGKEVESPLQEVLDSGQCVISGY